MIAFAIESLETNGRAILASYEGVQPDQLHWRSAEGKWSLAEILHHLHDEERDDFRVRLRLTLESPDSPWPPIDPEGWVKSRDYASRSIESGLEGFAAERAASIAWLKSLDSPDLERAHVDPKFPDFPAGSMLASWVAHDILHLRQIVATKFHYASSRFEPYSNRYAGDW